MRVTKLEFISRQFREELIIRLNLGIFLILTYNLSNAIIEPLNDGGLMLIIYSLIEVSLIAIVMRFGGGKNIATDFNELNLYSLIIHIVGIPAYYFHVSMDYHNYLIKFLFFLYIARLFYFGSKTESGDYKGLPMLDILGYLRKSLPKINKIPMKYLPNLLFFGSALPLWFIIYQTNNTAITLTTISLMVYIYFVSYSLRTNIINYIDEDRSDAGTNTARLCELFRSRSEEEQTLIIELLTTTFTKQNNPVSRHFNRIKNADADLIAKYAARHYFLLARLMQVLPGDITNQTTLTPEQVEMCLVVSKLAEKGILVIEDGLALIDDLLFMATSGNDKKPPSNYASFLAYLEEGAEFMRESASDYSDAANHFKEKEPPEDRE